MNKNVFMLGKICSGKTTAANYLVENYGYKKTSLAEPIKLIEQDLRDGLAFGDIYEKHIGQYITFHHHDRDTALDIFRRALEIPRETPKPRRRLQFIGTEGFRKHIDDEFWIKLAYFRTKTDLHSEWVIDDVRFINEYRFFYRHLWIPVGVNVLSDVQEARIVANYGGYDSSILNHASELDIDYLLGRETTRSLDGNQPMEIMFAKLKEILCLDE